MSKYKELTDANENFKVVVRVRPPLPREIMDDGTFENTVRVEASKKDVIISEYLTSQTQEETLYSQHQFTFDYVYDQSSKQSDVYKNTAREAVLSTLEGYNATIIAYGQTGSGKTYTMEGGSLTEEKKGIIPRATEEIFNYIQTRGNPKTKFLVRASYLQIYRDVISDLLKPERTSLSIREDKKKGVYVYGLSEWIVRSPSEICTLMQRGAKIRATGSTRLNEVSSRSHAVFLIIVEQSEQTAFDEKGNEIDIGEYKNIMTRNIGFQGEIRESFKIGKLNLVDLAGSERIRISGATGQRLDESRKINQSLSALGNVIAALTDQKGRLHIPYRDSKLTRLLEDSLGGNCKTTMIAMISPALEAFPESLSTLKFANRAKSIRNEANINEDLDQRALLRRYEQQLKQLKSELEAKTKNVVDKRRLLELEQEKKRAEDDKRAAISALTLKTEEFVREQQKKRELEQRIAIMQSQLLIGGEKIQETPMFKNLVKQEHERVHRIYLNKLQELEKERQSIEEDKAQVDRYKQLLLKQRDIMIALTTRLNERDEYIMNLQEELDAYDQHQKTLEDSLNTKNELISKYENALKSAGVDLRQIQLYNIVK